MGSGGYHNFRAVFHQFLRFSSHDRAQVVNYYNNTFLALELNYLLLNFQVQSVFKDMSIMHLINFEFFNLERAGLVLHDLLFFLQGHILIIQLLEVIFGE